MAAVKVNHHLQDWQIRCVCGGTHNTCNNGWMRTEIEEKARAILIPLINGDSLRLSPEQQNKIATWIALKCMISEFDLGSYVTTHPTQRKRMMRKQLPPLKGWGIWIGSCDRSVKRPHWTSVAFNVQSNPKPGLDLDKPPARFNSHSSTQVINKLFIQVVRSPEVRFINKWKFRLPDRGGLFRIWPPASFSINWPARELTEREINLTTAAIEKFLMEIAHKRIASKRNG